MSVHFHKQQGLSKLLTQTQEILAHQTKTSALPSHPPTELTTETVVCQNAKSLRLAQTCAAPASPATSG